MIPAKNLRVLAGVIVKELPRYLRALSTADDSYLGLCNRDERLEWGPGREGVRCHWQWTSDLHAVNQIPWLGSRLAARAHARHPVQAVAEPISTTKSPVLSFVIGHRGRERLPHLLATLESIAGQQGVGIECIVVEQDSPSLLDGQLPAWVRHVHAPPPSSDMPYCRSWTFNVGARLSRGAILVMHDNDMIVPADYAANIQRHVRQGNDVVNLKRFVCYMSEQHTSQFFAGERGLLDEAPEAVTQNTQGGGSIAITIESFRRIGGMDESFIGWGGEDNEFWERAQTLRVWPWAYLAIWHLWHGAQAGKKEAQQQTLQRYQQMAAIPVPERIAALNRLDTGQLCGPTGWPRAGLPCAE